MMVLVVMGPDIFEHASSISRPWVSTIGEMAGAPPPPPIPINRTEQQQKLKEQDWQTYYNRDFRFSIDYPNYNGKTNITEKISADGDNIISIYTPSIIFSVIVSDNTIDQIDAQELAVTTSLDLVQGESLMAGGVTPLIQDGVVGYAYGTMLPVMDHLYFESSGFLYIFIMTWPAIGENEEIDRVIDSIKFFD